MGRVPATGRYRGAARGPEFKLHRAGGPYPFPAPAAMQLVSGSGEILLPILLVLGLAMAGRSM
ncbi:hypothetical protein MESS2_p100007 [Mesorhizobium metallidurans STM 2683]|uniref:Uncharacterized protein n=1 Tax=Mesorhizobium metallidurans STM 2683 TaxID=1297569 RepID=M5EZR4_9HYPH|nr:hypothetical protein MESS2_p100007 [Mesorhizobium metallidurans STM 2683]